MNKVPQLQSPPSNVQHHFHLSYICCYEVICVEYQSTIIYLNDTGPIRWCFLHPTISKKSLTKYWKELSISTEIQLHSTSSNIQPRDDNVYDTSSSPSWNMLTENTLTCTTSNRSKRHVITHIQHSTEMNHGNRCWWINYLRSSHLPASFNITSTLPTFAVMKWYEWSIKAQ